MPMSCIVLARRILSTDTVQDSWMGTEFRMFPVMSTASQHNAASWNFLSGSSEDCDVMPVTSSHTRHILPAQEHNPAGAVRSKLHETLGIPAS